MPELKSWRVEAPSSNYDPRPFDVPKVRDFIDTFSAGHVAPSSIPTEEGKVIIVKDMTMQDFSDLVEGIKMRGPSLIISEIH